MCEECELIIIIGFIEKQSNFVIRVDQKELKELYVEELALQKRIQGYFKEHPKKNPGRVEKVVLLVLYRIFANVHSAWILTSAAHKSGKVSFFQLPIGILLRCAFTDCLFALYIQRVDNKRAVEEFDLRTFEYANSLLERKEVYRDQVNSLGMGEDDDLIDNLWELSLEDNFLHLLTFDESKKELTVTKKSKWQMKDAGFSNLKSVGTKEQKDFLLQQDGLEELATRLFHYYKYFSQYEHFSENGQGDILASSEENGNDNIHFPSAIRALSAGVEEVIRAI